MVEAIRRINPVPLEDAVEDVLSREPTAREENSPASRLYLIAYSTPEGKLDAELTEVDLENPDDLVGKFLSSQTSRLRELIEDPKKITIPRKARGTRRVREKHDIRENKLKQFRSELAVIAGGILTSITLVKDKKDKIVDYRISDELITGS
jgi:hypothetical protein